MADQRDEDGDWPARTAEGGRGDEDEGVQFDRLLDSAARLQEQIPDSVLVGGTAAILYAGHRFSYDHVLADLSDRYDAVLDALEREGDWVTNRTAYGKIVLGELGGIETGVRQLIRARPLEIEQHRLPGGRTVMVPTIAEIIRIKAFLIVKRNQTRDYLDLAALADRFGIDATASILSGIDNFYADQAPDDGTVAAQVAAQLASPRPKDSRTVSRLDQYKGLAKRWHDWSQVVSVCQSLADRMIGSGTSRG